MKVSFGVANDGLCDVAEHFRLRAPLYACGGTDDHRVFPPGPHFEPLADPWQVARRRHPRTGEDFLLVRIPCGLSEQEPVVPLRELIDRLALLVLIEQARGEGWGANGRDPVLWFRDIQARVRLTINETLHGTRKVRATRHEVLGRIRKVPA